MIAIKAIFEGIKLTLSMMNTDFYLNADDLELEMGDLS